MRAEKQRGFTLVEVMVAISIFVIVAFIVTTTVLVILDANRRANAWRSIMENVNFAVDSMSYKLKFGSQFRILDDSGFEVSEGADGTQLEFVDRDQHYLSYCKRNVASGKTAIFRCDFGSNVWAEPCQSADLSYCQPITSDDIDVIEIKMAKSGCGTYCPLYRNEAIVMMVRAEVYLKGNEKTTLDFQTTVTQSQSEQRNGY